MRDRRTTPVVYRLHPTRTGLSVAVVGVVAIVFGFLSPLSAEAGDHQGGGIDPEAKPWICHPVEGAGEVGYGWNLIDPNKASSHIDEDTGAGFHTRKDGSTDVYATYRDGQWTCPGYVTPTTGTTTSPTSTSTSTTSTSTTSTSSTTSTTATSTTTSEPPVTTSEPPVTTTSEPPVTTTSEPVTETPDTGATVPSTTTPVVTEEPPAEEAPEAPATVAPAAPTQPARPQVGAARENAVPQAQTDGADLVGRGSGWTPPQSTLVGAGLLLLAAGGLLSVRRDRASG